MKIPKKKLCKCKRYYHDLKYELCWECWGERPLDTNRGFKKLKPQKAK